MTDRAQLADLLAHELLDEPSSGIALAGRVGVRKATVLAELRTNPRFQRSGSGSLVLWSLAAASHREPNGNRVGTAARARAGQALLPALLSRLEALEARLAALEARLAEREVAGVSRPEPAPHIIALARSRATSVYIARDGRGAVLYVGITAARMTRLFAHGSRGRSPTVGANASGAAWWSSARSIELLHFDRWEQAARVERRLIAKLRPRFNVKDKP